MTDSDPASETAEKKSPMQTARLLILGLVVVIVVLGLAFVLLAISRRTPIIHTNPPTT